MASGAGNAPPPTTIPDPSAAAAIAPPSGTQTSATTPPSQTLTPQGPPPITTIATSACNSDEVSATLTGSGPYNDNPATAQEIISLTSKNPCYISGYANLVLESKSGSTVATNVTDGNYTGASLSVSNVTLSSVDAGSFLIQYTAAPNGATSSCPLETSLTVEIPNQSLTVSVNLNGVGLLVCGAVNVSPFIQGNSIDRYVS